MREVYNYVAIIFLTLLSAACSGQSYKPANLNYNNPSYGNTQKIYHAGSYKNKNIADNDNYYSTNKISYMYDPAVSEQNYEYYTDNYQKNQNIDNASSNIIKPGVFINQVDNQPQNNFEKLSWYYWY